MRIGEATIKVKLDTSDFTEPAPLINAAVHVWLRSKLNAGDVVDRDSVAEFIAFVCHTIGYDFECGWVVALRAYREQLAADGSTSPAHPQPEVDR